MGDSEEGRRGRGSNSKENGALHVMGGLWEAGKKAKKHWRHHKEGEFSVPGSYSSSQAKETPSGPFSAAGASTSWSCLCKLGLIRVTWPGADEIAAAGPLLSYMLLPLLIFSCFVNASPRTGSGLGLVFLPAYSSEAKRGEQQRCS